MAMPLPAWPLRSAGVDVAVVGTVVVIDCTKAGSGTLPAMSLILK